MRAAIKVEHQGCLFDLGRTRRDDDAPAERLRRQNCERQRRHRERRRFWHPCSENPQREQRR